MKKIIFLLICILFSLSTFAQRVALNNTVSIDEPKELQKITKGQAVSHANEKFKGNKLLLNFDDVDTNNARLYKFDDIIIELKSFDTTFNFGPGHAVGLKKEQDGMGRKSPNYSSNLKIINGNTVVIINNIIENTDYCFFFCFNSNNTRTINGRLVYDKADKDKAEGILNHILNSIKFKD